MTEGHVFRQLIGHLGMGNAARDGAGHAGRAGERKSS
jgi:hypothetical protein